MIHGKLKYIDVSLGKSQYNMQLFVGKSHFTVYTSKRTPIFIMHVGIWTEVMPNLTNIRCILNLASV